MLRAPLALLAVVGSFGCFSSPPPVQVDHDTESPTGTSGDAGSSTGTVQTTGTDASATDPSTTDISTSDTGTRTGDEDSTGGVVLLECVEEILDPALGSPVATVGTQTTGSDFTGSCGGNNTNDVAFQWIAPYTDYFIFDTEGSTFDTVLYLLDGDCEGSEIACNDNEHDTATHSRVIARMEQGQQVVVVVDGLAGETGDAVLNINPVTCPAADLTGQALPATFSNAGGTNEFSSSCGGAGNPERTFRFTAQEDGLYRFRATSSAFTPILTLQDGPACGGPDLQCNRSPGAVGATVVRNLEAGQSVTIVVDSFDGSGTFEIDAVNLNLPCPVEELGYDPISGTITDFEPHMTTSCGPAGSVYSGEVTPFPAVTYGWTSPGMQGSNSACLITYTGGFPAALSLQEGRVCAGAEVQCYPADYDEVSSSYSTYVQVGHIPPTDFTITLIPQAITGNIPISSLDFTLELECFAVG